MTQRGPKYGISIFGLRKCSDYSGARGGGAKAMTPTVQKKDSVTVTPTVVKYIGFTARPNAAGLDPCLWAFHFEILLKQKSADNFCYASMNGHHQADH
jgi:hypothetical protein